MRGHTRALVTAAVMAMAMGADAAAQDATDRRTRITSAPERVMAVRERLQLTEDQLAALEQLRAESVERRAVSRAQMDEMRSRLRAGEIDRDEMRALVQEMRQSQPDAGDRRARIEGILTEDQLSTLQEIPTRPPAMRGARAGVRGARSSVRGARGQALSARATARGARAWARAGRDARAGRAQIRWYREGVRDGARMRANGRRAWRR